MNPTKNPDDARTAYCAAAADLQRAKEQSEMAEREVTRLRNQRDECVKRKVAAWQQLLEVTGEKPERASVTVDFKHLPLGGQT